MPRASKRRIKKVGLPAESLIYTGERAAEKIEITLIQYDEQAFEEHSIGTADACAPYRDRPGSIWIAVDGVHNAAQIEKLGECFGLHRLVTEDILSVVQRPKVDDYGDYLFLVLKMLAYDETAGRVLPEQVSIIFGRNFLLSFQEGQKSAALSLIHERLRAARGRIRKMGSDYLAYSLLDAVVDGYFVVLDKFGDRIDALEDQLMERPSGATVEQLYQLKRELLLLHRSVWPVREVVTGLMHHESEIVQGSTEPYLRDVYDHTVQAIDTIEIYREMLSEMIGIYLSSASNRLNAIMKVLTIIATIFMPLTFIAGVYGMNFRHMPELDWTYGYPAALFIMAAIGTVMVAYFKRKDWM
jgi:magnesium transporter